MEISGKTVVITGAGSGIGAALALRFSKHGAQVVVSDRNISAAQQVADEIGGLAVFCDVGSESNIQDLIRVAEQKFGQIDIFVSNAGLGRGEPNHAASAPDADWDLNWRVHVMAHVWAARALLPRMIERGSGYFINVASAAGLLNQIGDAAYSATKHAAVSFAESLAISHGSQGIGVSVVCPQYVATPLIGLTNVDAEDTSALLTAFDVADSVVSGVQEGRFLILPHPQVSEFTARRAADHDRWVSGMQVLRKKVEVTFGSVDLQQMYKLV